MLKLGTSKLIKTSYPLIIISLCAFFLFYKYILQIYPSIITEELMREFQLSGVGLGNLAATFYYAYTLTQLFVGITLDKFSTRWLTAAAIFSCALGVFLFAHSHTVFAAGCSRALMGMGVAFATVSYMKIAALWFAPKNYAVASGLLATAAMTGAIFGQAPLAWLISQNGWRACLNYVGMLGFILAFLFMLIVRDAPKHFTETNKPHLRLQDMLQVFKNKQNWLLTLYSGLAFSPVAVFGGLWGNPFLEQAYDINKTQAASLISLIFIGLGIGSPVLAYLSNHLGKRILVMGVSTLISCIAIIFILYFHHLPLLLLGFLLLVFGFGIGSFMLVFSIGKELNSIYLIGTVIAMINISEAAIAAITEPLIGKILDLCWSGEIINGVPIFSLPSYHIALAILPIYLLIAATLLLWVQEKSA